MMETTNPTKLLLAGKSCERDCANGANQAIRDTWMRDVKGADTYFFVGEGKMLLKDDEVWLDCGDAYLDLPYKTRAILKWSLNRGYDFTFLFDTDTYVIPDRLLSSGFEAYDLVGLFNGAIGVPEANEGKWSWVTGGNGYWISQRAAEIVVQHEPDHWAEDCWVLQVLGPYFQRGDLKAFSHEDYGFHTDGDEYLTRITSHCGTIGKHRAFDPQWMRNRYAYNALGTLR